MHALQRGAWHMLGQAVALQAERGVELQSPEPETSSVQRRTFCLCVCDEGARELLVDAVRLRQASHQATSAASEWNAPKPSSPLPVLVAGISGHRRSGTSTRLAGARRYGGGRRRIEGAAAGAGKDAVAFASAVGCGQEDVVAAGGGAVDANAAGAVKRDTKRASESTATFSGAVVDRDTKVAILVYLRCTERPIRKSVEVRGVGCRLPALIDRDFDAAIESERIRWLPPAEGLNEVQRIAGKLETRGETDADGMQAVARCLGNVKAIGELRRKQLLCQLAAA
eukprot:491282-Pleurochrysis_carterae.AAC.4